MKLNKKKIKILTIGIGLGLIAGFAYWRFVGCSSGSCGITANWHTSTLFGGIFGYLLSDGVAEKFQKKAIQDTEGITEE